MHRSSVVIAALVFLHAAPAAAQGPAVTPGCSWDARCSTGGATLAAVEVDRTNQPKRGTVVTYRLKASGLPAGPAYTLWMRRLDGKEQWIVAGYAADSSGTLRCADRAAHPDLAKQAGDGWCPIPIDSISLGMAAMMPGEPVSFALRAHDGSAAAYARVIPHPVAASADGCALALSVVDPERKSVAITGSGFAPGETVRTVSVSGKESIPGSATVGADGTLAPIIVLPAAGAGRGGDASYEVAGARCTVKLSYAWGNRLKAI
jgi:hypothetical protein